MTRLEQLEEILELATRLAVHDTAADRRADKQACCELDNLREAILNLTGFDIKRRYGPAKKKRYSLFLVGPGSDKINTYVPMTESAYQEDDRKPAIFPKICVEKILESCRTERKRVEIEHGNWPQENYSPLREAKRWLKAHPEIPYREVTEKEFWDAD